MTSDVCILLAALKGVRRGGNAASRAELFSGHVQEVRDE
jgi:hypothetical protein